MAKDKQAPSTKNKPAKAKSVSTKVALKKEKVSSAKSKPAKKATIKKKAKQTLAEQRQNPEDNKLKLPLMYLVLAGIVCVSLLGFIFIVLSPDKTDDDKAEDTSSQNTENTSGSTPTEDTPEGSAPTETNPGPDANIVVTTPPITQEEENNENPTIEEDNQATIIATQLGSQNTIGSSEYDILIIEVYNFSCPACKNFHDILKPLYQEYDDRIVFQFVHAPPAQNSPRFPNSWLAHRAAEAAAKQGKFWEMHNLLFDNFETWAASYNDDDPLPKIEAFARELGLDMEVFQADLNSEEIIQIIKEDQLYAASLNVPGTPTFYVNGQQIDSNFASFGSIETARATLDGFLAEAQE